MRRLSTLFFSIAVLSSFSYAGPKSEAVAFNKNGVAVVCASETTSDIEDASTRINQKISTLDGTLTISLPVLQQTDQRLNVCVTVSKK